MAETPTTIKDQAAKTSAAVLAALDGAVVKLDGRMWKTEATKAAANALRSLRPRVLDWQTHGKDAGAKGTPPPGGGWAGWFRAGEILTDGVTDLLEEGDRATLANVKQTLEDAAKDAERVAIKVSATVGKAAAAVAKPLTIPLALIAVGLVAVAVIMVKR